MNTNTLAATALPESAVANKAQTHFIPMQLASIDIWDRKYRLKKKSGEVLDQEIHDTFSRVARTLADLEPEKQRNHWYQKFLWALENGAIPAGRILSNAGAMHLKTNTSTINCTVSSTIRDSMASILDNVKDAGMTLSAGCGIGYEFSTLRPRGAFVSGAGASTSGPLSFMDIFDRTCATIASAGNRRGAQMATFDIRHPDVFEFIQAKREDGRLRQFNLSLLIPNQFIDAVRNNEDWNLIFPVMSAEQCEVKLTDPTQVVWATWPDSYEKYIKREDGLVACRIYRTVKARALWDVIMESAYDFAEPGVIFVDRINDMNNNWWCEDIRATNPCGEQPLPPNGSCLLGSINLTRFVRNPFTPQAHFDSETFARVVRVFTRMLDNVVEINGLPLEAQRNEILSKRRHGMGITGLGSAMTMLCMRYGSKDSIKFTSDVCKTLALESIRASIVLADQKGCAPILNDETSIESKHLKRVESGLGSVVQNRTLLLQSPYMQRILVNEPQLADHVMRSGLRSTHHTSIAPTGTISLSFGNNCSNGIEPSFAHQYTRNIIREGKKTKESVEVLSYELLAYRQLVNPDASPNATEPANQLPSYFVSADELTPDEHIAVQAAAQYWIDSSISKTINVPTDISFERFKEIYLKAFDSELKGCTTFRFNPEAFQGVLVKPKDLENTEYVFTLEDDSEVRCKGNDIVEYDGEQHTAANLFDALKEGTYGKH